MNRQAIDLLRCPACRGRLHLLDAIDEHGEVAGGKLICAADGREYPITFWIPRFVLKSNYADNFGFQWNAFRSTQLDSHSGIPTSRERLLASTGLAPEWFHGKVVLGVGCGAGRFAEAALLLGAVVYAMDYSTAVDACRANLAPHPRLTIAQGGIFRIPFQPGAFDLVYCLGVLQHTPDVRKAFLSLPPLVKPGGRLVVDVYRKTPLNLLWPKYWLRPFLKGLPPDRLFRLVEGMVKHLLPISLFVGRIPIVGRKLRYVIPVANHEPDWSLSLTQVKEWALLNTFDMFSPAYDSPQSGKTLRNWFEEAGMSEIEVFRRGVIVGRGQRRAGPPAQ